MNKTGEKKERKASEKKDKDKKAPKTEKGEKKPKEKKEKKESAVVNTEVGIHQVNSAFILDEENKEKDNHDSVMVNENGKIEDNLEKEINKDIFNGYVEETNTVEHNVNVIAEVKTDGDKVIGITAEIPENKVENNEVTYVAAPGTEPVEVTAEEEKKEETFVEFPVVEEPIENVPADVPIEEDFEATSEDEEFEEIEEEGGGAREGDHILHRIQILRGRAHADQGTQHVEQPFAGLHLARPSGQHRASRRTDDHQGGGSDGRTIEDVRGGRHHRVQRGCLPDAARLGTAQPDSPHARIAL